MYIYTRYTQKCWLFELQRKDVPQQDNGENYTKRNFAVFTFPPRKILLQLSSELRIKNALPELEKFVKNVIEETSK
jgi:hypothetical protein